MHTVKNVFQYFDHRHVREKEKSFETWQEIQDILEQIQSKLELIDDTNILRWVLTLEVQALAAINPLCTMENSGNIKPFLPLEKFPPAHKNEVQLSFKHTTHSAGRKKKGRQLRYSVVTTMNAQGALGVHVLTWSLICWQTSWFGCQEVPVCLEAVTGEDDGKGSTKSWFI